MGISAVLDAGKAGTHFLQGGEPGREGGGRESGCLGRCRALSVGREGVWKGEVGGEIGEMVVPDLPQGGLKCWVKEADVCPRAGPSTEGF